MSNIKELAVEMQAPLSRPQMRVYSNAASLVEVISRAASDPAIDVGKMQALLDMHERLRTKEAEQQFNISMGEAQGEMRPVGADATNPQTRSKYASYAALDRALRPIYGKHGFALSFDTGTAPESSVDVICHVSHREGHVRSYHVLMPTDGKGAKGNDLMTKTHATGAALSYGARYLLKLIFNVAVGDADDDGNGASAPLAAKSSGTDITEQQVAHVRDLIARTETNIEMFCAHFKISAIPDLSSNAYLKAVTMLTTKLDRKAAPK